VTQGRQVRKPRLAIILCKFLDKPTQTRPPRFYEDYYARLGTGGLADYWNDVTFGGLDLTGTEVLGWFTMKHYSGEVSALVFPGGRDTLVQWGKDAATANGVNLSKYDCVLVVQNWGVDHGAAGNGVVIVDQREDLLETNFIAHEMGHMFHLPHSFGEHVTPCISGTGEYCDAWDIMSAMNVYSYPGSFEGLNDQRGPGLNAFNLKRVAGFPDETLVSIRRPDFSETVTLSPLNQPLQLPGSYAIEITPDARPESADGSLFTIEYRQRMRWDRGLPSDGVLIHEEKKGLSYLQPTPSGSYLMTGQRYFTLTPRVYVQVAAIDTIAQKATVRVWDRPESSLRQEDSDAKVYLIERRTKRLLTALTARRSTEVRRVPDGALSDLREGTPVD
jgi:hypothetical protein